MLKIKGGGGHEHFPGLYKHQGGLMSVLLLSVVQIYKTCVIAITLLTSPRLYTKSCETDHAIIND